MSRNKDDPTGKECNDLSMSASAKEFVDKGAIFECQWNVISLDDKKKHIKAYNPNIPHIEFFNALNDNELNEVMSDFRHHTGIDSGIDETYVTTKFFKFSNRKYENKYREFASHISLSSDEETFTIELNLRPVGGTLYTIEPNEKDRYEANINNLDKPISILVSSSDGKYRTVSVAVGDRVKSYTLENNEYMGGFISEVIEFMGDGKIGEQLKKVSKVEKETNPEYDAFKIGDILVDNTTYGNGEEWEVVDAGYSKGGPPLIQLRRVIPLDGPMDANKFTTDVPTMLDDINQGLWDVKKMKKADVYDTVYEILYGGNAPAEDIEATAQALYARGITSEMIDADPPSFRLVEQRFEGPDGADELLDELHDMSKMNTKKAKAEKMSIVYNDPEHPEKGGVEASDVLPVGGQNYSGMLDKKHHTINQVTFEGYITPNIGKYANQTLWVEVEVNIFTATPNQHRTSLAYIYERKGGAKLGDSSYHHSLSGAGHVDGIAQDLVSRAMFGVFEITDYVPYKTATAKIKKEWDFDYIETYRDVEIYLGNDDRYFYVFDGDYVDFDNLHDTKNDIDYLVADYPDRFREIAKGKSKPLTMLDAYNLCKKWCSDNHRKGMTAEANINNLDKPISILVSSSDGKYRTVSVAVGDRVKSYTLENNEYMGGFISEVIEFMSDGIIGEQLKKVRKSKKEQDGKSEEHGNNETGNKEERNIGSKKTMRAALYVRVSTEDQAREGFSLDAQTEQLKDYCRANNWEISGIYREEGYSCRNTDRPEYKRMMDDSDKWDVLLVLKMDRIHCNSANFTLMMDDLGRKGKEFNSTLEKFDTSTPMGRFAMDIIQRIAQWEDEKLDDQSEGKIGIPLIKKKS